MPHKGIWEVFKNNGYEAYFVGGCVRDALIGRVAKDIDIATDALPEEICNLFENHYDMGLKYGSVTVEFNNNYYDVTTFRTESGYSNFRHPDRLEYTNDIRLDLKRRDFTVNAMAFCFEDRHIDLCGGITDLNKKLIKAVGAPDKRFREDALRMLRAIRFSCELGFAIEVKTLKAIGNNSQRIKYISKERIYSEIKRAVVSAFPENLMYLKSSGLGKKFHKAFKSFNYHNIPADNDWILRLTHILQRKDIAIDVLEFLKADKGTIHNVLNVLAGLGNISENTEYQVRKLISSIGIANAKRVLILKKFDIELYNEIVRRGDCTSLTDLALNGNDLITTEIVS